MTVPVRDGKVLICDGRVAETREQIGGCWLIDGKDLDEAIEVASQLPGAWTGTIQVRPIWELEVDRAPIEIGKASSVATKAHTSKGIVLALSCAAQFMVVLDIAIVNVALPSIQQDLAIEQSILQWIVIAYSLMLGGRMADLLGRRRMLLTGLTLFSSASLLAGLAGSAGLLIGAPALQGFGAALLPPAALSILAVTFAEGAQRNRALGITARWRAPAAPPRPANPWIRVASARPVLRAEVTRSTAPHGVAGGRWQAPGRVGP